MRNCRRHTGTLEIVERLNNSTNGNPRWLVVLDGINCRTAVDSDDGYGITNFDGKPVSADIGIYYGKYTIQNIRSYDMNDRELFDLPTIADDQPMNTSPFYHWLMEQPKRVNVFIEGLSDYVTGLGYDKALHKLDSDQLESLRYVFVHYGDMWTPIREPIQIDALLSPSTDTDALTLMGTDTRYKPTEALTDVLEGLALVYPAMHKYIYFEIIRDCLFVKYQTILGSRRIANLITNKGGV